MKAIKNCNGLRRLCALLLAAALMAGQLAGVALAEMAQPSLFISLSWNGEMSTAAPVSEPGYEDSYWLYLPLDAFNYEDSVLTASDYSGQYARFALEDGTPLGAEGIPLSALTGRYTDAGVDLTGSYLTVTAFDTLDQPAATFRLFLSTQAAAPMPAAVEPIAQPAPVTVACMDRATGAEISSNVETHDPGLSYVTAPALPGYDLDSEAQVAVTVDQNGANPNRVEFWYKQQISPVTVTVTCLDETGTPFFSYQTECAAGDTEFIAQEQPGYDLSPDGPDRVTVSVTAQGASMDPVIFHYVRRISDVSVPVRCLDAQSGELLLADNRTCAAGENTVYAPEVPGYIADTEAVTVVVTADGAQPGEVIFQYHPAVTEAPATDTPEPATPTPEPATPTPEPATDTPAPATATPEPTPAVTETTVPVYYVDNLGNELARADVTVTLGENYVRRNTDLVSSAYTLRGEDTVRVVLDGSGVCTPDSVTFTFFAPVDVTVYYLDFNDEPVADPQVIHCVWGVNVIYNAPENLLEGYLPADTNLAYVNVDENGADQQEIIFRYGVEVENPNGPTDTPEPKLALVPVSYRTTTSDKPFYVDNTVTCFTGENTVEANPAYVPEGYAPVGDTAVTVMVDDSGAATPETVEFLYSTSGMTRSVMVYYRGEDGRDLSAAQSVTVGLGSQMVDADDTHVPEGYVLTGELSQTVTLTEDGTVTPDYIVFHLQAQPDAPTETIPPEVTEAPQITDAPAPVTPAAEPEIITRENMDAYCNPKNSDTPMRRAPWDGSSVIGSVQPADLVHIDAYAVTNRNETWYEVTVGDQTGYLRDTQVHVLSQDELDALFATPTPVPVPETPIPDGAYIDRWATLNKDSVNFRAEASTKSSALGRFSRNQKVFVYDSITVSDTKWYRASINGKDGFIMAEFVDLMSAAASQEYQATLDAPMPVRTAAPTPAPATDTPSPEPATPTPSPVISPTPSPYVGYALTTRSADMRTGADLGDDTLFTLPANTLLYLHSQVYVDGVCWHNAQVISSQIYCFARDEDLRRVTPEEAAPYLAALTQTDSPAPPTIQPDPYSCYAVTNGDNVMLRNYADEKAEIAAVLGRGEVVWVITQEYVSGSPYYWELVQYGKQYGYVRSDQLRRMDPAEQAQYEESLRTPMPVQEIIVTPAPVTQGSMSSYGYVTTDNVRLRSGPGTNNTSIRKMNKYAFALVLGTENNGGETWYHISQAGTEGYVMAQYFRVLSLGELSEFLTSDEYRQSSANAAASSGAASTAAGGTITSVEDFNTSVWNNPSLVNVTYEPFSSIIASPTPDVEQLATPTPTATPASTDTPTPEPSPALAEAVTPAPNEKTSGGSGWVWGLLAAAVVLGGGGAYGYSIYRANQRKQAQRAAARRQSQQAARSGAGYARPTQQTAAAPQRAAYPKQTAPAPGQQTSVFMPPKTAAGQTPVSRPAQGTQTYQPVQPTQPTQGTQAYQPVQPSQPTQSAPDTQPYSRPTASAAGEDPQAPVRRHRRSDKHQG